MSVAFTEGTNIVYQLYMTMLDSCTFAEVASQLLLPQPVTYASDIVLDQHLNNINILDSVENESL